MAESPRKTTAEKNFELKVSLKPFWKDQLDIAMAYMPGVTFSTAVTTLMTRGMMQMFNVRNEYELMERLELIKSKYANQNDATTSSSE